MINNNNFMYLFYLIIISYLLINIGIFSDDFADVLALGDKKIIEILIPDGNFINAPLSRFTHNIWFHFCTIDSFFIIDLLRIFYIALSLYLTSKFFNLYLDKKDALLTSFLFIFFPSHDSIPYCLPFASHALAFALYFYSYYLAYYKKVVLPFILAIIASFMSYGSTPMAIFLFVLFLLNKEYKKSLIMIIPNIIYSIYFIFLSIIFKITPSRILEKTSDFSVVKQFILQILTFTDAMVGPSMWLKIYYSFFQLSTISWIIGALATIIFYKTYQEQKVKFDKRLLLGLIVLMVSSFGMFAVTGRYPQLAFNMGNRTTFWGSLLFAYLIVILMASKKMRTLLFAIIIFVSFGISDHWKKWSLHQQEVIKNISNNQMLKRYEDKEAIYVSGNQYSKYGPISHIEFMSEDWVPKSVLSLALQKNILALSLNKRHKYVGGYLVDTKYDKKTEIRDYINVYDSENNILLKLKINEINNYIDSLPQEKRHWIMGIDDKSPIAGFIINITVKLMPRLKYTVS